MTKTDLAPLFAVPKFRQLLAVLGVLWLSLILITAIATDGLLIDFTDPLVTPIFYVILFGGGSLWVLWQYRRRRIQVQQVLGYWPQSIDWRALVGLWLILFMFSIGAFQVSFALLSYRFPEFVRVTLQDSLFLGPGETAIPWLYNSLMLILLVVAAPVLEEFLFRGFLLHRWGTRWNVPVAVLLSSLLFGLLHGNILGLTLFGLAMALLYLRTASLGVAIAVHSFNNAIAAGLELMMRWTGHTQPTSLADFRSGIWLGTGLLVISIPLVVRFVQRNWSDRQTPLPYGRNRDRRIKIEGKV